MTYQLAQAESPSYVATEEWVDNSGTNPAPDVTLLNKGQIWYNTTGDALKYTTLAAGAWASGGALRIQEDMRLCRSRNLEQRG